MIGDPKESLRAAFEQSGQGATYEDFLRQPYWHFDPEFRHHWMLSPSDELTLYNAFTGELYPPEQGDIQIPTEEFPLPQRRAEWAEAFRSGSDVQLMRAALAWHLLSISEPRWGRRGQKAIAGFLGQLELSPLRQLIALPYLIQHGCSRVALRWLGDIGQGDLPCGQWLLIAEGYKALKDWWRYRYALKKAIPLATTEMHRELIDKSHRWEKNRRRRLLYRLNGLRYKLVTF